jgi:hypothetical protein
MKFIWILLAIPFFVASECGKHKKKIAATEQESETTAGSENNKDSIPACVKMKIDSIKKETKWNPPAEVDEYIYNGKQVFLFSADCCDQFNMLYDDHCNIICAPSGGFTGRGDGKCADFLKTARLIKVVWKDPR